jgi:hypothetical protein
MHAIRNYINKKEADVSDDYLNNETEFGICFQELGIIGPFLIVGPMYHKVSCRSPTGVSALVAAALVFFSFIQVKLANIFCADLLISFST